MQQVRAMPGCLCQRAVHAGRTSTPKAMSTRECSNWFLCTARSAISGPVPAGDGRKLCWYAEGAHSICATQP